MTAYIILDIDVHDPEGYEDYKNLTPATIAAYGSMMIVSYYLGQKKYPIPYEINKISTYIVLSTVLSAFSFYVPRLRESYIFGVFALIFFGYYIYKNEKNLIIKIIKRK